ncbi:MAG: hypothetical protein ACXWHZ_07050 [Usitatibacter sp.]
MADPFDELRKRAQSLPREEKIALFRAIKDDPSKRLPDALLKTSSPEEIEKGLNRIRFVRRARVAVWVALVIAAFALDKIGVVIPSKAGGIGFVAVVMSIEGVLLMLPCPRCGFKFISRIGNSFTRNCCSCGLSLDKGSRAFFW